LPNYGEVNQSGWMGLQMLVDWERERDMCWP